MFQLTVMDRIRARSLRVRWRERASASEQLFAALLALDYGVYFIFLIIWYHRAGGITEAEEWRIFVEVWTVAPLLAISASGLVRYIAARLGGGRRQILPVLVLVNGLALLAAAAALRWSTTNWGFPRTPTMFGTRLAEPGAAFAAVCTAVVILFPAVNFGFLLTLRVARDACKRFLSQPILARMIPIVLPPVAAVTVLLLSVRSFPGPWALAGIAVVAAMGLCVRLPRRRTLPRWLVRVGDVLVVVGMMVFVFDPHLHFNMAHHGAFLGPVTAIVHGRTLLVDVVSQYGVFPIYLLAAVFTLDALPMSYVGLALIVSIFVIVQYACVYVLLRSVLHSVTCAIMVLAAVILVNFVGGHGGATLFPSGGPLRLGLPYALLLLVAARCYRPSLTRASRLAESAVVAIASVWSVEVFLFALATAGGIVAFETAFDAGKRRPWVRPLAIRACSTVICVSTAHLALALYTYSRAGQWPQWERYLVFVRAYTPVGEGLTNIAAPLGGGWVAVVLIYLASLIACAYSLPFLRTQRGASALTIAFGMTLLGISQLTYYLGLSISPRLHTVVIPAVFVAGFWGERLTRRGTGLSRGFRLATVFCLSALSILVAVQYWHPLREWIDHSSRTSLSGVPWFFRIGGCPALPGCLTRPEPTLGVSAQALRLIEEYAPQAREVAVFLAPVATVEVVMLSGKGHVFPVTHATEDGRVRSNRDRIVNHAHPLRAGDVLFVDRPALSRRHRDYDVLGRELLRAIVDRLCEEFRCEVEEKSGSITVERLHARRGS